MPTTGQSAVTDLTVDLNNFRTVAQKNEHDAVRAMISISPAFFWGLMESLLDDGYLPTENIIVLAQNNGTKLVKEGNRRVAALKIALGLIDTTHLDLPTGILQRIAGLSPEWLTANATVPSSIYEMADSALVDKIVTLTHGKGSKAGRDAWGAVARARHNRDMSGGTEAALDLLEKFLVHASNHTQEQRDRWAGDFNLSVLDEVIKKIAPRLGASSSSDLAKQYPKIENKKALDEIVRAVGLEKITFPVIRDSEDFAASYGVPALAKQGEPEAPEGDAPDRSDEGDDGSATPPAGDSSDGKPGGGPMPPSDTPSDANVDDETAQPAGGKKPGVKVAATPLNDERSVKRSLRTMKIAGQNRAKVATLRTEAGKLKLTANPIAFCFLLRSMFEISAKAYCEDNEAAGLSAKKSDGTDRFLMDVLRDVMSHLTQNKADKAMVRALHGPGTELAKTDGILSITSLNQLVHHPTFAIKSSDIPTAFAAVFPLLEHMNK